MEDPEFVQDPMFPPGWHAWDTGGGNWHARPPGRPDPRAYVHADDKQECADRAWLAYRWEIDSQEARP